MEMGYEREYAEESEIPSCLCLYGSIVGYLSSSGRRERAGVRIMHVDELLGRPPELRGASTVLRVMYPLDANL